MRKIRFSTQAKHDIREIAEHIADDNLRAALQFVDHVEATCGVIGDMPEIGKEVGYGRYAELRMMPVRHYRKYLIFYTIEDDGTLVVRVLYSGRDLAVLFE